MEPFDPSSFRRRQAGVLGMGRSGLAAAVLLARRGFRVLLSDTRPRKELRPLARGLPAKVKWEGGGHSKRLLECSFAVKSPGILPSAPALKTLAEAGVPVYSELEVGLAFCKAKDVVAVTGTNGKSTTTMLVGEALKAARRRVHVAGNIGVPVASVAAKAGKGDALVIEASSYQLEDSRAFKPRAAAVLNVTADHLDHHGGMAAYMAAKERVFGLQDKSDVCVFNASDPISMRMSRNCRSRRLYFGLEPSTRSNAWVEAGRIKLRLFLGKPGKEKLKELTMAPPDLPGAHNLENAMAAALLGLSMGADPKAVQKAFRAFKGVEHRLEECGLARGIRFVNDSKATNVESTMTALKAFAGAGKRILLVLGGLHKGFPYTPLKSLVEAGVKGILTIGSAARKVEEDLSGLVPIFPCETLAVAVDTALRIGSEGDILLLSPACASFDQFKDFEDRGRQFKRLARLAGAA